MPGHQLQPAALSRPVSSCGPSCHPRLSCCSVLAGLRPGTSTQVLPAARLDGCRCGARRWCTFAEHPLTVCHVGFQAGSCPPCVTPGPLFTIRQQNQALLPLWGPLWGPSASPLPSASSLGLFFPAAQASVAVRDLHPAWVPAAPPHPHTILPSVPAGLGTRGSGRRLADPGWAGAWAGSCGFRQRAEASKATLWPYRAQGSGASFHGDTGFPCTQAHCPRSRDEGTSLCSASGREGTRLKARVRQAGAPGGHRGL